MSSSLSRQSRYSKLGEVLPGDTANFKARRNSNTPLSNLREEELHNTDEGALLHSTLESGGGEAVMTLDIGESAKGAQLVGLATHFQTAASLITAWSSTTMWSPA